MRSFCYLFALACFSALIGAVVAWRGFPEQWYAPDSVLVLLALILLSTLVVLLRARLRAPVNAQIRALSTLISAWRDGDFAGAIVLPKEPGLRELTHALNDMGESLRQERRAIVQRELLLDTVVQQSPAAFVLCDHLGRVVYHNIAARELIGLKVSAQGQVLAQLMRNAPAELINALAESGDTVLTLQISDQDEVIQVSNRDFTLQARPHRLHTFRRLTREFSRQEVKSWKNVIRVISHELNNSLGPILSLSDSGRVLLEKGLLTKLPLVLSTIGERAEHFIGAYAEFARLPAPTLKLTKWRVLLEPLVLTYGVVIQSVPEAEIALDPHQVEQVLINLIKNALESGSAPEAISVNVKIVGARHVFTLSDRGSGMEAHVLANALLPFYSTKRSGTGLGLALVREIVEAHGGQITLRNRKQGGLSVRISLPTA